MQKFKIAQIYYKQDQRKVHAVSKARDIEGGVEHARRSRDYKID